MSCLYTTRCHQVKYLPYQLLHALREIQEHWAAVKFAGTYADAKEHLANFAMYKQTKKRAWVTEKQDVTTLFGNVQTKLKTYRLREYIAPHGVALSVRFHTHKVYE